MNLSKLRIVETRRGGTVVFRLSGDLSSDSVPLLTHEIEKIEAETLTGLHLDMSDLQGIDSSGVGALVGWHRHFTERGVEFRLLHVRNNLLRVLQLCNLTSLFNIGPKPTDKATTIRWQRQALWESHEYSEQVVAALGEGLIGLDPSGQILFVNPAAERLLGWRESDLLGKSFYEAIPPVDSTGEVVHMEEYPLLQATRGGTGVFHGEVYLKPKEAGPVPFSANATPIFQAGRLVGAVIGLMNITERKQAEAAMLRASRMEAAATLAGGIAHDFNNLMVGVLGNAELLRMECADRPDTMRKLADIAQSAQRAGELAQQMLAFARGGKYRPKVLSLNDTLRETLRLHQHAFPPRVWITWDIEPKLWNILADPAQMGQVVMNLCINAVEAIQGNGRVTLTTRNLEIDEEFAETHPGLRPGRYAYLSIEDTGCGMSPETQARVFEPFFTTKFQGRGMGLAAIYGIIRNHEGHISVHSEVGRGTTFKIYLPATEAEIPAPPKPTREIPTGTETVLVVDDEEMVLEVTRRMLERLGYRVLCAHNGKEAVETARSFDGDIHLALLDMGMPVMGGEEAYPMLMEALPELKVILYSGYEPDSASLALLDAGAKAFLHKPFRVEVLAQAIRKVLDGETLA